MPDDQSAAPYMSEAIDEFIKGAEELRRQGGNVRQFFHRVRFDRIIDEAIAEMQTARTKLHYAFEMLPKGYEQCRQEDAPSGGWYYLLPDGKRSATYGTFAEADLARQHERRASDDSQNES